MHAKSYGIKPTNFIVTYQSGVPARMLYYIFEVFRLCWVVFEASSLYGTALRSLLTLRPY